MTPNLHIAQGGEGIATNGLGKPCSSHLNLTVSLADVGWQAELHHSYRQSPAPKGEKCHPIAEPMTIPGVFPYRKSV
jgi:hypothetical protein